MSLEKNLAAYDTQLDTTGLLCPMPVLRARRKLSELSEGTILQVIASDEASIHDMPAFCHMAGHHLIFAAEEGGIYYFNIRTGVTKETKAD